MNLRATYFLFAAVIVVLVVFVLVLSFGPRGDQEDYLFPEIRAKAGKSDQIAEIKKSFDRVVIERLSPSGEPLEFDKEGTTWVLTKPYRAKIDSTLLERFVGGMVDSRLEKNTSAVSRSQAGLDSPSVAIVLHRAGKTHRITLGNMTIGSGGRVYALSEKNSRKVLVVRRSSFDEILKANTEAAATVGEALRDVADYRPRTLLADGSPIPWDLVQKVTLRQAGKELSLQKDTLGAWVFLKPDNFGPADPEGEPGGPATDNIAGVKPLLTRLAGIMLPDTADVIEGVDKFADFGLDAGKEAFRIELGRTTGGSDLLLIGKPADEKGEKVFARVEGERFVMKLPAKPLEPIRKLVDAPTAMRDRTLTQILPAAVDAIDITLAGQKRFELRKVGLPPQWRVFEGGDAYENANGQAIQQLLDQITQRRNIRDFPDPGAGDKTYGLEVPAAEIAIWQDGIIKDEKKDDPPPDPMKPEEKKPEVIKRPSLKGDATLRLKLGKKEKDVVFVRRQMGILSNVVTLPEATLTAATKSLNDYLDLTLPSFDVSKVMKLTITRGANKYEVEKEKADPAAKVWKVLTPADISGRDGDPDAMNQIVFSLQMLTAEKLAVRKATDADLAKFGLKPAKYEVAIGQKDVKDPHVVQLGNETEDKLRYYVRVSGSERVFEVPKVPVMPIVNAEITDPTIWRIDPAKILGIKITGWRKLTGSMPLTLDLVRKSASDWSVKGQADYVVDAAKAEAFAGTLFMVRGDHFIKHKGGPEPAHQLDVQMDALTLEVTVDGEKEPFILTLGAETKRGDTEYYHAASNRLTGAVFVVFKNRFADLRTQGRGYFQKAK